jgi:hypothetical protein
MQIGSFIFTPVGDHKKVFIQIAGDGEGGEFRRDDLPRTIQKLLELAGTVASLTVTGHGECDRLMFEFWHKHF